MAAVVALRVAGGAAACLPVYMPPACITAHARTKRLHSGPIGVLVSAIKRHHTLVLPDLPLTRRHVSSCSLELNELNDLSYSL